MSHLKIKGSVFDLLGIADDLKRIDSETNWRYELTNCKSDYNVVKHALFIDRPDKRNEPNARQNLAIIDVAKHRSWATDEIELQFIGEIIESAFQQYESQSAEAPSNNPF